jgi:hypothetical protein
VHAFDAEVDGATLRIVIERFEGQGTSLDDVAVRRAETEVERLPAYERIAEREAVYGGAAAFEVCARFRRANGDPAYLRRAHVATPRKVLSFSMSAPLAARAAGDAWMDAALESLSFRADD